MRNRKHNQPDTKKPNQSSKTNSDFVDMTQISEEYKNIVKNPIFPSSLKKAIMTYGENGLFELATLTSEQRNLSEKEGAEIIYDKMQKESNGYAKNYISPLKELENENNASNFKFLFTNDGKINKEMIQLWLETITKIVPPTPSVYDLTCKMETLDFLLSVAEISLNDKSGNLDKLMELSKNINNFWIAIISNLPENSFFLKKEKYDNDQKQKAIESIKYSSSSGLLPNSLFNTLSKLYKEPFKAEVVKCAKDTLTADKSYDVLHSLFKYK